MYETPKARVRIVYGDTDWFDVRIGLHQGSDLSPFLFTVTMDVLTEHLKKEEHWELLYADDLVIVAGGASAEGYEKEV